MKQKPRFIKAFLLLLLFLLCFSSFIRFSLFIFSSFLLFLLLFSPSSYSFSFFFVFLFLFPLGQVLCQASLPIYFCIEDFVELLTGWLWPVVEGGLAPLQRLWACWSFRLGLQGEWVPSDVFFGIRF